MLYCLHRLAPVLQRAIPTSDLLAMPQELLACGQVYSVESEEEEEEQEEGYSGGVAARLGAQPLRGLAAAAAQRAAAGGGSLGAAGAVSQPGAGDVAAQWQQQQFFSMGSAALHAALRDGEP